MRNELVKSVEYGELLDMMYLSKGGEISKRRIQVIQIGDISFRAYCHLRGSKRTFTIDNVLALVPVIQKESLVIQVVRFIPSEAIPYYENMIYLPLIISVLEKDRGEIEIGSFKLKKPYIDIIEGALKAARHEMKETSIYLKRNNMKVIKRLNDRTFTEYLFLHDGHEERRKYLNIRLRNRTEELISIYFTKSGNQHTKGAVI